MSSRATSKSSKASQEHKRWSRQEIATLKRLGDDRSLGGLLSWNDIAVQFQDPPRSAASCRVRYNIMCRIEAGIDVSRPANQKPRQPNGRTYRVDNEMARSLARAPIAEHTSLTAAFFGDPLPGRSALDRKRSPDAAPAGPSLPRIDSLKKGDTHASHH